MSTSALERKARFSPRRGVDFLPFLDGGIVVASAVAPAGLVLRIGQTRGLDGAARSEHGSPRYLLGAAALDNRHRGTHAGESARATSSAADDIESCAFSSS